MSEELAQEVGEDLHARNEAKAEAYDEVVERMEVAECYFHARMRVRKAANLPRDDPKRFAALAGERAAWMMWRLVMSRCAG